MTRLQGTAGPDALVGGDSDLLDGCDRSDRLVGLTGVDTLRGGNGDDRLYGCVGNDFLYGDDDDDWVVGGANADRHFGGTGYDGVSYLSSGEAETVTLAAGAASEGMRKAIRSTVSSAAC